MNREKKGWTDLSLEIHETEKVKCDPCRCNRKGGVGGVGGAGECAVCL